MKKLALLLILLAGCVEQEKSEKFTEFQTAFVAFPQDCNANPPMVFGGKLLAEMDRTAGITARRFLYNSTTAKDAVTIAMNNVEFKSSAEIKDLIIITGKIIKVGEKSITMQVVAEKETKTERTVVVKAEFVFVAYDLVQKKAIPHGLGN